MNKSTESGDETVGGSNPGKGESRPNPKTSEGKKAANQANARKSTGPSKAGKERSKRNATKAGLWARELYPIEGGPFGEDESQFHRRVTSLIGDFAPATDLEHALAKRAASALIRLDRIDRYESVLNETTSSLEATDEKLVTDLLDTNALLEHLGVLYGTEEVDEETPPWISLAIAVRSQSPKPREGVKGLWDAESTPQTDVDWRRTVKSLLAHHWESEAHCEVYLYERLVTLRRHHAERSQLQRTRRANDALRSASDKLDRPRSAAWREFSQAMTELGRVRRLVDDR